MATPRPGFPLAALAALLATLLAGAAGAEPLNELSAELSIGRYVSDNVRSASGSAKESGAYFVFSPKLSLHRDLAFGDFSLAGGGTGYAYDMNGGLSRFFGEASAALKLRFTNRIEWEISNHFIPSPISLSDTDDSRVNQIQMYRGTSALHYEAPLGGPWEARLSAQTERDVFFDYDRVFVGPKPDRGIVSGAAFLRRRMGRRSDLTLENSLSRTIFDQEWLDTSNPPNFADFTAWSGVLTWSYHPRRSLTVAVGGGASGLFMQGRGEFTGVALGSLTWSPTSRSEAHWEARRSQSAQADGKAFNSTSFSMRLTHKLTRSLRAEATGAVTLLGGMAPTTIPPPSPVSNEMQLYTAGSSLILAMGRYIEGELAYHYSYREAQFATADFGRNTGSLTLTARY